MHRCAILLDNVTVILASVLLTVPSPEVEAVTIATRPRCVSAKHVSRDSNKLESDVVICVQHNICDYLFTDIGANPGGPGGHGTCPPLFRSETILFSASPTFSVQNNDNEV